MANEDLRLPPQWILDLAREKNVNDLQFITEKLITKTDLNKQQNRLLIPKEGVEAIKAMLFPWEMIMANLQPTPKVIDRGGLEVRVFTRNKFRVEDVQLQRWVSAGSIVINGREMNVFRAWSKLNVNDKIEMWGFRDRNDKKLCFAVGKM